MTSEYTTGVVTTQEYALAFKSDLVYCYVRMKTKKEAQVRLARASSILEALAKGDTLLKDSMAMAMYADDLLEEVAEYIESIPDETAAN